jgi:hypothetical protein
MAYCSQAQLGFRPFEEGIAMGIEAAERAISLDPSFPVHGYLADVLLEMGEHEAALAQAELITDPAWRLQVVAMANHALGRLPESQAALQELREGWEEGEVDPGAIFAAYVFMEDMEAAFEWLERVPPDAEYGFDSYYDSLNDDPLWTAWIERAGPSMGELAAIPFQVRLPR